jgi:hypothetical protein
MFEFGESSPSSGSAPATSPNETSSAPGEAVASGGEATAGDDVPYELHEYQQTLQLAEITARYDEKPRTANERHTSESLQRTVSECRAAAQQLAKGGVKRVKLAGDNFIPTDKVEERICARIAKLAITWDQEVAAAEKAADAKKTAELEEIARPFKAAKITGDRLEYAVRWHKKQMYGLRGVKLNTPQEIKAARVIFMRQYNEYVHRYYRTEFAGDKIVSDTTKEYELDPGIDAFR